MRVIAGKLGGRLFNSPKSRNTHPMSEKVRGAIFNVLGDINHLSVLDPFGGSGAISIEAASRGAEPVLVIESDRSAQKIIEDNIKSLDLESSIKLVKANTSSWLINNEDKKFNIAIVDPPYDKINLKLMTRISKQLNDNGILVLSWPSREIVPVFEGYTMVSKKDYGDAQLVFYSQIT